MKFLALASLTVAVAAFAHPIAAAEPTSAEKACAQTAAWAGERDPAAPGADFETMDARTAMIACTDAAQQNPQSAPDRFRLGRAELGSTSPGQGVADVTTAAEAGYVPAMTYLALRYREGNLFPRDLAKAFQWATRASAAGSDDATEELAALYQYGQGVQLDVDHAIALLQPLADKGIASAQNSLGSVYLCTCGHHDIEQAAKYFRLAAANGNFPEAERNLASLLAYRQGPVYDPKGALFYYQRAAAAGLPAAIKELAAAYAFEGRFVAQDTHKAEQLYQQLADLGFPEGLTGIGNFYFYGLQRPADRAKAADYYARALNKGDFDAAAKLGPMLIEGDGVPVDLTRGLAMLVTAGNNGSIESLLTLGQLYSNGQGVPADLQQAVAYYTQAAAYDSTYAMDQIGDIELRGGLQYAPDPAQAAEWFTRAAKRGDPQAASRIGIMLREGNGVAKDLEQSRTYLLTAAGFGEAEAEEQLGEIYETGDGIPADIARAVTYYRAASDQHLPLAQYRLGQLYLDGKAGPDQVAEAIPLLQAALDGYMSAATVPLGSAYAEGRGTAKDPAMALAFYNKGCSAYVREACIAAAKLQIAAGDQAAARDALTRAEEDPQFAEEARKLLARLSPA